MSLRASFVAGIASFAIAAIMFAGAEIYYLREQAAGVWTSSATGDPLTILPQLGIVFVALAVPFLLNTKLRVELPNSRLVFMVALSGCLAALVTGFMPFGGLVTPAGLWWIDYGFPVSWRVDVMVSCPPFCNTSDQTIYNPLFYVMDALFYIAICYSAVLIGSRRSGSLVGYGSNERIGSSEVRVEKVEGASPG